MARQEAEARAASRRLLATSERELQRIVLDMHDGPVQDLFAALSQLQVLERALAADAAAEQRVRQAMRLAQRCLPPFLGCSATKRNMGQPCGRGQAIIIGLRNKGGQRRCLM